MYIAAQNGHLDVARLLLGRGAHPNAAITDGATPLYIAAQNGHLEVARLLLDRGANTNAATTDGATPLHIAAQSGHLDIVKQLVIQGTDRTARTNIAHGNMVPAAVAVDDDIRRYLMETAPLQSLLLTYIF